MFFPSFWFATLFAYYRATDDSRKLHTPTSETVTVSIAPDGAIVYPNGITVGGIRNDAPQSRHVYDASELREGSIGGGAASPPSVGLLSGAGVPSSHDALVLGEKSSSSEVDKKPKKKKPFLPNVPMVLKVVMYWWSAGLFLVMVFICADYVYLRYLRKKGRELRWEVVYEFEVKTSLAEYRRELWNLLVDVPRWSDGHPSLRQAVVSGEKMRMDAVGRFSKEGGGYYWRCTGDSTDAVEQNHATNQQIGRGTIKIIANLLQRPETFLRVVTRFRDG